MLRVLWSILGILRGIVGVHGGILGVFRHKNLLVYQQFLLGERKNGNQKVNF